MKRFWPCATVAATIVFAFLASAQDAVPALGQAIVQATVQATVQSTTPAAGAPPQYFTLNLPAGTSLISSPLNSGQVLARDAFLGLPSDWPLFWGWNSASQSWLTGDQAPMTLTGGYEVYLQTPTTVVVEGQPYNSISSATRHIHPGWHLFGVPFIGGISWKDFKLYASGNPIGIETAVEMGWVDPKVITTQGSQVQYHVNGEPFQPGAAYWIKTNVPLDMRVEGSAPATTAAGSEDGIKTAAPADLRTGPTALSEPGVTTPPTSYALMVQATAASGGSSSGKTMGWLAAIFQTLAEVAKGVAAFAEGNVVAGVADISAGTFGLIEHGLATTGDDSTTDLTQIDSKLDSLIGNVGALSSQITGMDNKVDALVAFEKNNAKLGTPLSDAETWLNDYYTDHSKTTQSREWARWTLAGCDTSGLTCPSAGNPVTAASYQAFKTNYIQQSANPKLEPGFSTDNFPLFWAYSVIGHQKGDTPAYNIGGTTADSFVTEIYQGLTDDMGQSTNGLTAYMQTVFANSACVNDVTYPSCNLYDDVYSYVEDYFGKAIGYQTQLVSAVAESWNVLGQHNPAWANGGKTYMAGVNQKVNREAEAFLQVAEQIALYRAADGTEDWGNFANTDAAKLLARADFVVARLAGANYLAPATPGNYNPPWPSSGIVGRVFYVNGEKVLSGTRGVCINTSMAATVCTNPVFQIGETVPLNPDNNGMISPIWGNSSNPGAATGGWPYLQWNTSSSPAVGTATAQWTIQRLTPMSPDNNTYPASLAGQTSSVLTVNSTSPERLGANLVVATYDENYNNPPQPDSQSALHFGSLNSIEGPIGRYGLKLGSNSWTTTGGKTNTEYQFLLSSSNSTNAPGAEYLSVTYPQVPDWSEDGTVGASWSSSANIKLDTSALVSPFTNVHLHWPTSVNVNLNGGWTHKMQNLTGVGYGRDEYFSYIKLDQQLLGKDGKVFGNVSLENSTCNSSAFNTCSISGDQSIDVPSLGLVLGTQYTFKAAFSSEVDTFDKSFWGPSTYRSAKAPSVAAWVINAPSFTLTKK